VAGYDILSAYLENPQKPSLRTEVRLSSLSLFTDDDKLCWTPEVWESRLRALHALTDGENGTLAMEAILLQLLQTWLRAAFNPLFNPTYDWHDKAHLAERERAIDAFMGFLCSLMERQSMVARIREGELMQLLRFFLEMTNKALDVPMPDEVAIQASPEPMTPVKPPSHRRNLSSLSLGASSSGSHSIPPPPALQKPIESKQHPSAVIVPAFLKYLSLRLKHLEPRHLDDILPSLFRSLSFFYSPLPRLTLNTEMDRSGTEGRLTSVLDALLGGPYIYTCQRILKKHLVPPPPLPSDNDTNVDITVVIQISIGAHRTLRHLIRRGLSTRLARAYIARESSTSYAPSGVPSRLDLPPDLFERAWPKDETPGMTINTVKLGRVLALAVGAWIDHGLAASTIEIVGLGRRQTPIVIGREKILDEAAGTVRDILEELDGRDGSVPVDDDEAAVVGEALYTLAKYLHPLKWVFFFHSLFFLYLFFSVLCNSCVYICDRDRNPDGSPWLIPFARPTDAPSLFLRTLSSLLVREHTLYMQPLLATTLLSVVDHLSDAQSARLPVIMHEQQELSPTSFDWLANWANILTNRAMLGGSARVLTRTTVMEALSSVFKFVKDMPTYRRPLVDLVYAFCERRMHEDGSERTGTDPDMPWAILGEEIVLKAIEDPPLEATSSDDQPESDVAATASVENIINLLVTAAMAKEEDNGNNDAVSLTSLDQQQSSNLNINTSSPSPLHSPVLSRMQSDPPRPERESGLISILSSLASGSSRSLSQQASTYEESHMDPTGPQHETLPSAHSPDQAGRSTFAVGALIYAFSGIAFNPAADSEKSELAKQLFNHLVDIMSESGSIRARLTSLQFLMRLRAGRDHGVYYSPLEYSSQDNVTNLVKRIHRYVPLRRERSESSAKDTTTAVAVAIAAGEVSQEEYSRQARARDRVDSKKTSRGRPARPSHSSTARSRSRIASLVRASGGITTTMTAAAPRNPLWSLSETLAGTSSEALPFTVMFADMASRYLVMYDDATLENTHILPISRYLASIVAILEKERDWEILSYVLCHLPVQLSNKHLFCGTKCRAVTVNLLDVVCQGIINGRIGAVDVFTPGVKARDACGLAYQTLGVLISYRRCFDIPRRNRLVEILEQGLEEQQETIKSCLRSLAVAAHELQTAMTRRLSKILERLSQIMSNQDMALHIINFLHMVGCIRDLHINFTEADYKMVFAVALQYLQHSNQRGASLDDSWALSQHMRIMSYSLVYIWFLALKLPDRPKHITFITRQLLLANEDNGEVDEPTEVCFDWLARYTYASADPRPATSVIRDLIMNPTTVQPEPEIPVSEKTWVLGNSIVTIRSLVKLGWIELISRRPSGETKFLCRVENFPLVGPGDVDPDLISLPAMLLEHAPPNPTAFVPGQEGDAVDSEVSGSLYIPSELDPSIHCISLFFFCSNRNQCKARTTGRSILILLQATYGVVWLPRSAARMCQWIHHFLPCSYLPIRT
jgi:tuberous sclerosis 2